MSQSKKYSGESVVLVTVYGWSAGENVEAQRITVCTTVVRLEWSTQEFSFCVCESVISNILYFDYHLFLLCSI